jgi:HD-GYP domain-containing protein (c-di-GMP phosphodiesterase class II)
MGRNASTRPQLRFAVLSALVVAGVAAAFAFVAVRIQNTRLENTSAETAADLVAPSLFAIFRDEPQDIAASAETRVEADALVWQLAVGDLAGVRVTGPHGTVLYQFGDPLGAVPASTATNGTSHDRVTSPEGASLFVSRSSLDGLSVEIGQDGAHIDEALAAGNVTLMLTITGFAFLAFALLQVAFWWGIRSYTRAHGHLAYLYDTGEELRASLDLEDVLSRLASDATKLVGGQYGFIAIFDEQTSDIVLRAAYDGLSGSVALHKKPVDDWFVRRCVATNTTIISNQSTASFKMIFGPDIGVDDGWILCAPMSIRERVVGCVAILRSSGGRSGFAPGETALVEHLAAQAVTAVEQAVLFAKVRTDAQQLESSYDSTLKALMAALDAKDEVTEGHCERVAKLTTELARLMGVPEQMMVHIERGALLHDVGKIGVPDGILKKPAALNDTEWEAMRKHPLLAGLMVSKVGFLEPALPILLYHHEKYDGTGYPFGLAGENIPVEARIFSIIDAYDAMTSDRPYRPAMQHHAAMEEVRRNTGTQFDPDVLAAFEQLMNNRRDLREQTGRRVLGMHDLDHEEHPGEHVA